MPRSFIKVDPTQAAATKAQSLLLLVSLSKQFMDQLRYVQNLMTQNEDNVVFTDIEPLFGVPTGQGQTVFNLVNGMNLAATGGGTNANIANLPSLLG